MLFDQIASDAELVVWIEALEKALLKIESEGSREIYTGKTTQIEPQSENYWQRILAVDSADWRFVMVNGLDGFGATLANNVNDYLHQTGLYPCLYEALRVLTELNDKGKQVHDIAGWGKGKCDNLRHILGLQSSFNLPKENRPKTPYVQNLAAPMNGNGDMAEWQRGVKSAVSAFEAVMRSGIKDGKQIMSLVQRS